jgi:PPP family 3-phenylpropionic acid transporter
MTRLHRTASRGDRVPYWRLSGFYFVYFASLGALLPYWGPYLRSIGLDAVAIGVLMGVLMATKIVAPNVWGWLGDRVGRPMAVVRLASLVSMFAFAGVIVARDLWALVVLIAVFGFFWNASLPQVEATTLSHLGSEHTRYSRIRLWGSVGFILTVMGLGPLLDILGPQYLPTLALPLFASIWLMSLLVPERTSSPQQTAHDSLTGVLRKTPVMALLLVCFLMQASHGPYYTFFSIYLDEHDYGGTAIGALWALGVAVEVLVFAVMHQALERYAARQLLLVTLLLAVLRWMLIAAFVDSLWLLVLAQTLHAATYGVFHAAAIHLVHHYFRGRNQVRGQALYSSVSFGAGGALGSLASGLLWHVQGPFLTYMSAATVSAIALAVGWRYLHDEGQEP